jgi:hypothetical protein
LKKDANKGQQGDPTMKDAKEGDQRRVPRRIGANNDTSTTSSSRNLRLFNYLKEHRPCCYR